MPDQDERDDLVAPAKGHGKRPSAALPNLNLCGDIGLKIARDGTWYYQGGPIARKPLVKLFASVLRLEDDGRYYLVTPVEKVSDRGRGSAVRRGGDAPRGQRRGAAPHLREQRGRGGNRGARARHRVSTRAGRRLYALCRHAPRFEGEACAAGLLRAGGLGGRDLEARRVGVWSGGSFFPFPPAES